MRPKAFTAALTACVVAATLATTTTPAHAGDDRPTPRSYSPPVPGSLVDDWRPPNERWGAGNRGVDFAAEPGDPVVAAADGEVVFAGTVAGTRHVVVLHADGLRTTYAFLAGVDVRRGERVVAGERVGTAGGPVHFGVRAGDTYVDPLTILGSGPPRVHLVDDDERRPGTVAEERGGLLRAIRDRLVDATADGARWAAGEVVDRVGTEIDRARVLAAFAGEHSVVSIGIAIGAPMYRAATRPCTPAAAAPPPRPRRRRLLVRVAGLNSSTGAGGDPTAAGAMADLDANALGYAAADDIQFSYAGGTTDERAYTRHDTYRPIRESGARLGALLDRLAADHPGVPIDVVAHSMGGLVARTALATTSAPVEHLVTFATPHHGADLATVGATLRSATRTGDVALALAGAGDAAIGLDPNAASVRDLAEGSELLDWLDRRPLPPSIAVTSIAGRHDWVVPVPRAHLDGATNVVVDPGGVATEHDALPGSAEAARAAALALAGAPPPCEGVVDAAADAAFGQVFSLVADGAGLAAARSVP